MSFVRTYDAGNAPRGIFRHLRALLGYPALVWQNRFLIHNSFRRELMSRWHGSFLGAFWMLAQPLFQFAIYYFIFGLLFGERGTDKAPDGAFAVYLFSGIIVFHALTEASNKCVSIIGANGNLVKKVAFPSEALVIPVTMISLVLYLIGAIVCLVIGMALGILEPGPLLLMLPVILAVQAVFTIGFGLFLANLNVFVPDVGQLWRIISMAWIFLTPVFWMPDRLANLHDHGLGFVETIARYGNPAFSLVMCHRLALGGTSPMLGEFWPQFGVFCAWALFFLVLGYTTFVSQKEKYADIV